MDKVICQGCLIGYSVGSAGGSYKGVELRDSGIAGRAKPSDIFLYILR